MAQTEFARSESTKSLSNIDHDKTLLRLFQVLLLSCGLDKRCVCYDANVGKRAMSHFKTDFPLTSVDFAPDGTTLALGTTGGKILIYDLRYFDASVRATFSALV